MKKKSLSKSSAAKKAMFLGRHEEGTATSKNTAAHEVAIAGSHRLAVVEDAAEHPGSGTFQI